MSRVVIAYLMLIAGASAQKGSAESPESLIPVKVDWGNLKVESFSSVSTLNRAAQQQTTSAPPPPATTPPASPPPASSPPATTTAVAPSSGTSVNSPKQSASVASSPSQGSGSSPAGSQPPGTSSSSSQTGPYSIPYTWNPATIPAFPTRSSGVPPDVLLQVPTIGVKRIELNVDDLAVDINLNAQVANLVSVNAGIFASIKKVNLTISDVGAELELVVRLGHLAEIVNRVFQSLDLNPLLITTIGNVTNILDNVVQQVDGLLGSITRGGTVLNFLIDNLGHIVQQVTDNTGKTVNTIVGDYQQNMTYTGKSQMLANGLTQKTYKYGPLNAIVNIIFNGAGQLVSAVVAKQERAGDQPGGQPGGEPQQPQQPSQPQQPPSGAAPAAQAPPQPVAGAQQAGRR